MFNFTTTNVINTKLDITTGKEAWSSDTNKNGSTVLHIKRVGDFVSNNVTAIHKANWNDPELAKVTIDLSNLKALVQETITSVPTEGDPVKGMTFRLGIYLALTQASQDSRYSNDLIYKGKPISIEFMWLDDAATTAQKLVDNINKYEAMVYNEKLIEVTCDGTTITLEAKNEFQRFKMLVVDQFLPYALHGLGEYIPVKTLANDLTEVDSNEAASSADTYFVGKEGFGTFSYVLRNLRIPTEARTAVFAQNADEAPIWGAHYVQYTIHYCTKRGQLGLNAVGQEVLSLTTHVFYVKDDLASDFETLLTEIAPEDTGIIEVPAAS